MKAENNIDSAEAIIVFTGGKHRVDAGIDLLKKKKASQLFISGVNKKVQSFREISSVHKNLLIERNRKIILGKEAQNTHENAIEAKNWIKNNNINSIILVTSNYHMPRASLEFRRALPEIKTTEYPVFAPNFQFSDLSYYPVTFYITIKEYNKCLYLRLIDLLENNKLSKI